MPGWKVVGDPRSWPGEVQEVGIKGHDIGLPPLCSPPALLHSSSTNLSYIYRRGVSQWTSGLAGHTCHSTGLTKASSLLFMKTQVAERAPRKGKRVAAEKKQKLEAEAEESEK